MSKLLIGDCRESLKELIEAGIKVQMAITSPPYYNQRSYLPEEHEDKLKEVGSEQTPEDYVANLVEVFGLVRELLTDNGTFWLNIGDSYYNYRPGAGQALVKQTLSKTKRDLPDTCNRRGKRLEGLKEKDLIGIPWMSAFALRDSGWYLRSSIIWAKGVSGQKEITKQFADACVKEGLDQELIEKIISNLDPYVGSCMPESVRDRPTRSHEDLFLFSKSQNYYYDRMAIAEEALFAQQHADKATSWGTNRKHPNKANVENYAHTGNNATTLAGGKRNRRSVWAISTRPSKISHFAIFPPELIEPCILAGSKPGDLVLDPFMGSGTVAGVCEKLDRRWIGIELNPQYAELVPKRIQEIACGK
jgi:DNA modification methylase